MADATCAVDDCERAAQVRGWCDKHYRRWKKYGTTEPQVISAVERFLSHVAPQENGCWHWTDPLCWDGYAQFWNGTRRVMAHRFSYELFVGQVPHGLVLDHLCRTRHCVNPDHLEAVTQRENVRRSPSALAAMYARRTHCNNGHEFTPENTIARSDRPGRVCRTCRRARQRKSA